ncbi:hypothetical protein Lser_V15G09905 [Lactuca serriola]
MAPQMSLSNSDGALKIIDADEESGFTFFDSSFIESGLSLEELRWKFYEKSVVVGPPLFVEVSNSPPMAIEANLVRVPVGDADRPFFPLPSDVAAPLILFHAKESTLILTAIVGLLLLWWTRVFFGKDSPELVKQPPAIGGLSLFLVE